jgi:HTH-type transcriptional regulator/antitoxin HigA
MATTLLDFSKPHVLRDESEYEAAVAEIHDLAARDPEEGTEDFDRLLFLSVLIEAYEDEHYPIDDAGTPQEMVDFLLDQHDMTRADLAPLLGGRSRVSDFFNGKRQLSLNQVRKLMELFKVSADLLIERRVAPKPRARSAAKGQARKRTSA